MKIMNKKFKFEYFTLAGQETETKYDNELSVHIAWNLNDKWIEKMKLKVKKSSEKSVLSHTQTDN